MSIRSLLLAFFLLIASPVWATTYYVSKVSGASNGNACTSAGSSACATIAGGAAKMSGGDTLLIQAGTYNENMNASGEGSFPWRSGSPGQYTRYARHPNDPSGSVIVRPTSGSRAVYMNGQQYIEIDGLVLDGSNVFYNVIALDSSVHFIRFQNCEIVGGHQSGVNDRGYHAIIMGSDIEFIRNNIHSPWNYCAYVIGSNNTFDGNTLHDCGGYGIHQYNQGPATGNIIRNNIFYNLGFDGWCANTAPCTASAIVLFTGSDHKAYNNVIYNSYSGLDVRTPNTIVYNNTIVNSSNDFGCLRFYGSAGSALSQNNICYQSGGIDNSAGATCVKNLCSSVGACCSIIANPGFSNAPGGDFHVTQGGPACGVGTNLSGVFTTDLEGNARSDPWDVGAYVCTPGTEPPNPDPGNIVAIYDFDEGSGTTVASSVNAANNGVFTPNAGWVTPGLIGQAAGSFDGTRKVEVSNTTGLRSTGAKTLTAWIKMSTTGSLGCDVVSDGDSTVLRVNSDGTLSGFFYDGGTWRFVIGGSGLLNNQTRFIGWTYDGAFQRNVIDNANVATTANTGAISYTQGAKLVIGAHGNGSTARNCTGVIDKVTVLDGFCTPACFSSIYNSQLPQAGLVATRSRFYQADAPENTPIAGVAEDASISVSRSAKIRQRWALQRSGATVTEYYPQHCNVNGGAFTKLTNSCASFPVCITTDTQKNMGDATSNLLTTGGFTFVPGRFVVDTINTGLQTAVGNGEQTEWEYGLAFGPSLNDQDVVRCVPKRQNDADLDGQPASLPTMTIQVPSALGSNMSGGNVSGVRLQ